MKKLLLFLCGAFFCTVANAQWGSALKFNGSSQYAHLGAPVTTITDNLTMEAWVNCAGTTSQLQPIVFNGGADTCGYGLILDSGDHIAILLGNVIWGTSDSVLHPGVWTHLAMVRNSGNWSLYLNGTSIATPGLTNQAPITPDSDFYVGAANHPNSIFNGTIDEVRVSNVARYISISRPRQRHSQPMGIPLPCIILTEVPAQRLQTHRGTAMICRSSTVRHGLLVTTAKPPDPR